MKPGKLERKLLAAAKAHPPSDAVPYAFEQRIMTALLRAPVPDAWAVWAGALWRAAAPCIAVAILCSVWTMVAPKHSDTASNNLSDDLEQTVLAAVTQEADALQ
ncbi:MAG: hypothetical protein RLY20_2575 [Verrucomicrobiota bacterium]|jgi:hypothetical protein